MSRVARFLSAISAVVLNCGAEAAATGPGGFIYAWAGDADEKDSDFLAVIDADPASTTYGAVVATAPVGAKATMPHHTEYETPPDGLLFANGWKGAHSFVIDVSEPLKPRLAADFKEVGGYSYAHSFARLPNGNVLATFQATGGKYAPPGGLVELDPRGKLVRAAPSRSADLPDEINWPYSLAVDGRTGRAIVTSTDMGIGPGWKSPPTSHIQIWSLGDLKLLATVQLPDSGQGRHHLWPAEPRLLADGSAYVNSFTCGLYRIEGIASERPSASFVHAFPGGTGEHDMCAVPVVYGKYWIQTVGSINGLVVLDVSDPAKPQEVSRLTLPPAFHMPHWAAADRANGRIVVTGAEGGWLLMLNFDEKTGQLSVDEKFGDMNSASPGIRFDRLAWPHGQTGKALVHGAVFSK